MCVCVSCTADSCLQKADVSVLWCTDYYRLLHDDLYLALPCYYRHREGENESNSHAPFSSGLFNLCFSFAVFPLSFNQSAVILCVQIEHSQYGGSEEKDT